MNAMILAAGFGTRLRPLTDSLPKALVPVAGKPLLQHQLEYLQHAGFDHIAVNAHYLADQVKTFLDSSHAHIDYSFEKTILNTGGGIKKMLHFFPANEPILVINVDILCAMNLPGLMQHHLKYKADATLVINKRTTSRPLLFDEQMHFIGRGTNQSHEACMSYGFCGIQVIQPELFSSRLEDIFYSIDVYIDAARQGKKIIGFELDTGTYWKDVGKMQDILQAEKDLK